AGVSWGEIRPVLPELRAARRARYVADFGLSDYDAGVLTADGGATAMFETLLQADVDAKPAANWVTGEYLRLVRKYDVADDAVFLGALGNDFADLIKLNIAQQITQANAK